MLTRVQFPGRALPHRNGEPLRQMTRRNNRRTTHDAPTRANTPTAAPRSHFHSYDRTHDGTTHDGTTELATGQWWFNGSSTTATYVLDATGRGVALVVRMTTRDDSGFDSETTTMVRGVTHDLQMLDDRDDRTVEEYIESHFETVVSAEAQR